MDGKSVAFEVVWRLSHDRFPLGRRHFIASHQKVVADRHAVGGGLVFLARFGAHREISGGDRHEFHTDMILFDLRFLVQIPEPDSEPDHDADEDQRDEQAQQYADRGEQFSSSALKARKSLLEAVFRRALHSTPA